MRILFCNIVWMKKYLGITDSDKPKYCGSYVSEQTAGNDIFNFSEYNGKCFGYVMHEGGLIFSEHLTIDFGAEYEQNKKAGGFLIVWCSFKDKNTARIVGWYQNAVLYREEQYQPSFTNPEYELNYYFEAAAKDCYLLSEKLRTFKIERSAKAGKGRGFGRGDIWFADSPYAQTELIPEVLKYIESYEGPRDNFVLTDELICAVPQDTMNLPREELIQKGLEFFEKEDYLQAISWFNAAHQVRETPDAMYYTAYCLYHLAAFDKARFLLEKSLETGQDSLAVFELLAFCTDMTGDWEMTIKYLEKMSALTKQENDKEVIGQTITEIQTYLDMEG